MNDPKLHETVNNGSRRDTKEILEQIPMNWKKQDARVLDIGCGDGSVTISIIQKFIPENFKKLVGCDRSQNSIDYAREHYGSEKVEFFTFDIKDKLPDVLKKNFDHIVSMYAFHWVHEQETAFTNVYNMLAEGGNCLIVFLGRSKNFEIFEELSRSPKWRDDLKDIHTKFFSPYYDSKDPAGEMRSMMERIGFLNVDVQVKHKTYAFEGGVEEFKGLMKCLNQFDSLNDRWDEFMDDCVKLDPNPSVAEYQLIVAYGSK